MDCRECHGGLIADSAPKILNILNGDCAHAPFQQSALPGETLVWREVYTEGPLDFSGDLPRFRAGRAAFLASITNYSLEKMQEWTETLDRSVLDLRREDVLRLWFDACMFDQSMLARILSLVIRIPAERRPRVELACENVIFSDAKIFLALHEKRQTLGDDDLRNGALCWESFVNYGVPENVSPVFRFMQDALERRRRETPDQNGLGETRRRLLEMVAGSSEYGMTLTELFQRLAEQEQYPWFGMETVRRFASALVRKNLLRMENERYFAFRPGSPKSDPRPEGTEAVPNSKQPDESRLSGPLSGADDR